MTAQARHRLGGYAEFAPAADLPEFVEALWWHQTPDVAVPPGAAHRVLPEFAVSVAFQVLRGDGGRPIDGGPILIGPKRRPQVYTITPGRELAAIRLKPEWVAPILGFDPLDVETQVVGLAAVHPALAARLHDALWRTRSAGEAIRAIAQGLARHRASQTQPSAATRALDMVRRAEGRVPCERIATHAGMSVRHLRRQVHDAMGISPKQYARTLRLIASMRIADASPRPSWADVAVRAGYCDQSHLIRECVAATGSSPGALHAERRRQVVALAELSNPA